MMASAAARSEQPRVLVQRISARCRRNARDPFQKFDFHPPQCSMGLICRRFVAPPDDFNTR
jgi:hypothetical protein